MTKEPTKTNDDVIAKVKAEQEAKKKAEIEAKEAERIKAEQEKDDPSLKDAPKPNPELEKAAADAAAKIEKAEKDAGDVPVAEDGPQMDRDNRAAAAKIGLQTLGLNVAQSDDRQYAKARNAGEKLRLIAISYPQTTPDEHVIFGFGGHRYTLGDLRDLTNVR